MTAAAEGEDADLVVLNTCHIREKAAEKAYSDVGRLRREDGSKPLIALAGCVAQAEGAEAKRALADDRHGRRPAGLSPPARDGRRGGPRRPPGRHRHAGHLQVRRACRSAAARPRAPSSPSRKAATSSAPIASCPTPAAPRSRGRGATSSPRRMQLVDAGAREIVLLGQNVNAWADGEPRPRRAHPRARRRSMGWSASATPPAIPPT